MKSFKYGLFVYVSTKFIKYFVIMASYVHILFYVHVINVGIIGAYVRYAPMIPTFLVKVEIRPNEKPCYA